MAEVDERRPDREQMKAKIVSDQHLEFRAAGGSYRKYFQAIHPLDGERSVSTIVRQVS